jgi:hypothetical protein
MLGEIGKRGQKAHAKAPRVMEAEFKIGTKLENEMIMRGILLDRGAYPETAGHAEMEEQDAFRAQIDQEIFRPSVYTLNSAAHGVFLEGMGIDEMPQLRLPHPYAGYLTANQLRGKAASNCFYFR